MPDNCDELIEILREGFRALRQELQALREELIRIAEAIRDTEGAR